MTNMYYVIVILNIIYISVNKWVYLILTLILTGNILGKIFLDIFQND